MAIISIDSYLLREIKPRLKAVLENCYIIDEVLKDFDSQSRESFKSAFCGKNAKHEVTVGFDFPIFKNNLEAYYLIQLGQAEETRGSIGQVQGSYINNNGNTIVENSVAKRDGDKLYFSVSKPIHELLHVEDIEFSSADNVHVDGSKIYFEYSGNEDFLNYNATITYVESIGDNKGIVKGMTVDEQVTVVGLSHNVDTARCLDAILKMILISMRENIEEQQSMSLQRLTFGDMSPMVTDGDRPIFGRPINIQYTLSMDMDYNVTKKLNSLVLKARKERL